MTRVVKDARGILWEIWDTGATGDVGTTAEYPAAQSDGKQGALIAAKGSNGLRVVFALPRGRVDRLPERELLRLIAKELRRQSPLVTPDE